MHPGRRQRQRSRKGTREPGEQYVTRTGMRQFPGTCKVSITQQCKCFRKYSESQVRQELKKCLRAKREDRNLANRRPRCMHQRPVFRMGLFLFSSCWTFWSVCVGSDCTNMDYSGSSWHDLLQANCFGEQQFHKCKEANNCRYYLPAFELP